ncbi:MAG TPA: addiction module toxin RelE, partial [Thermoanaerobaculia bacterium]|nr:addiction module toxin RelE [Thermoanaerobaculia bacterium]
MQRLDGDHAAEFNRKHARVGHLWQGRYRAHLVEKDSYLLEISRYIVLNPVRAHTVATPGW